MKVPTKAFTFKTLLRHYANPPSRSEIGCFQGALEGLFSVIVKTDGSFAALIETFELLEQETLNTEVVNTIANYLFYF